MEGKIGYLGAANLFNTGRNEVQAVHANDNCILEMCIICVRIKAMKEMIRGERVQAMQGHELLVSKHSAVSYINFHLVSKIKGTRPI